MTEPAEEYDGLLECSRRGSGNYGLPETQGGSSAKRGSGCRPAQRWRGVVVLFRGGVLGHDKGWLGQGLCDLGLGWARQRCGGHPSHGVAPVRRRRPQRITRLAGGERRRCGRSCEVDQRSRPRGLGQGVLTARRGEVQSWVCSAKGSYGLARGSIGVGLCAAGLGVADKELRTQGCQGGFRGWQRVVLGYWGVCRGLLCAGVTGRLRAPGSTKGILRQL